MKVEYLVWERAGQPISWVVEEGDGQTMGDFLSDQERRAESREESKARLDAELAIVSWSEDRSQPLPPGWRRARAEEVSRISEVMLRRSGLAGKASH